MNRLVINKPKPEPIRMTIEEFKAKARIATPQEVEQIKKDLLRKNK